MNKVIKATSEGRLYIETKDFFNQPEIISTINRLKESKLVKDINVKNMKKDITVVGNPQGGTEVKTQDVILGKGIDELSDIIAE